MRVLLCEARACRVCEKHLEPRPVFRAGARARLLIVGQAPGRRVHQTGVPWNDPSGDVLREWLGMDRKAFYDTSRIAIVPIGLCYPGTVGGADLPPRRECAPLWQARFRAALPNIELTLLVGSYAQNFYLASAKKSSVAETVRAFRDYLPEFFPLPHPSWRNIGWLKKNPWFAKDVLPALRQGVARSSGRYNPRPHETARRADQPVHPQGARGARREEDRVRDADRRRDAGRQSGQRAQPAGQDPDADPR